MVCGCRKVLTTRLRFYSSRFYVFAVPHSSQVLGRAGVLTLLVDFQGTVPAVRPVRTACYSFCRAHPPGAAVAESAQQT
jgi:hypothetical protein